jgi:PAS domain S-box-containing protein
VSAGSGLPATAETLFQAVAAAADALYVADAAGRIAFLNPAALKILGYADATELLGLPSHDTIHYLRPDGSWFPVAECPLLRPSRTGETLQLEQDSLVRKDGTQVAVSYSSAAFAEGTGLQGLRDRANAYGGDLTLDSPVGGPTVLTAVLPVPGH